MRVKELMIYRRLEHSQILKDMTFLMENFESDSYSLDNQIQKAVEVLSQEM